MSTYKPNPDLTYTMNPDLSLIDWDFMVTLYYKINWKKRDAAELEAAFKNSTTTLFVFKEQQIIAFGRVVGDGRYYAQLADIVVDPDFQGQGLGKYLVSTLNDTLIDYHFVTLSAAPGADDFYKKMGWKKQITSFIWPQGPKQLRQHCEKEKASANTPDN